MKCERCGRGMFRDHEEWTCLTCGPQYGRREPTEDEREEAGRKPRPRGIQL